jgi:hypothetical protein
MTSTKTVYAVSVLVLGLAVNGYSQSFLTNGLVAYYPFNGNANDASGNGNNGTVYGATLTTGRFGAPNSAYSFSSTTQYIESVHNIGISGNAQRTISLWCEANTYQPWPMGYMLGWNTSASEVGQGVNLMFPEYPDPYHPYRFMLDSYDANVLSEPVTNILGSWHHVVWTYQTNLGDSVFYLDSRPLTNWFSSGLGSPTNTLSTVDSTLIIGDNVGRGFVGLIDDVRIYNRALSPDEVAQLYAIESAPMLSVGKAVYLTSTNLWVGTNYQVQVSTDLNTWTNYGASFTATNSSWHSANYWDVDDWGELFFRLQKAQ